MDLTDVQKQTVSGWVQAGEGLSEIQKKLNEEFHLSLTYMDVRFLVIELGLDIKDKEQPVERAPASMDGVEEQAAGPLEPVDPTSPASGVSVSVDRVMKPGTVVSGTVTFSDGVSAAWSLDQLGRLGLAADRADYSPPPEDIQSFQDELRNVLEKRGF